MYDRHKVISLLSQAMENTSRIVLAADEDAFSAARTPGKWSRKLILGHLCDSAHNNLRRFTVGSYQEGEHIVYDPDAWVAINGYEEMTKAEVLHLWVILNRQICRVLERLEDRHMERQLDTGKGKTELHTLAWLADDYWAHMQHHLSQLT